MICWPPHSEVLDRSSFPLSSPKTSFINIANGSTSAFRSSRFSALICVGQMQYIFRCGSLNFLSSSMSRNEVKQANLRTRGLGSVGGLDQVLVHARQNAVTDLLEFCFRFHGVLSRVRGTMLLDLHILLYFHADGEAPSRARLLLVDRRRHHLLRHDGRLSTAFRHHVITIPTGHTSNLLLSASSRSTVRTTSSSHFLKRQSQQLTFVREALVSTLLLSGARSPQSSLL